MTKRLGCASTLGRAMVLEAKTSVAVGAAPMLRVSRKMTRRDRVFVADAFMDQKNLKSKPTHLMELPSLVMLVSP
jgi:hypothetical protein